MKFSENWLREWVNPDLDTAALAEQLTMAGLEVDGVEPAAPEFTKVVVGQVVQMEKHPQADKLNLCTVDVGTGENLSIVCGAANVYQGAKVPAAVVGAVLPGNFKIKKAKLRGVESFGMLCSEKELGLSDSAEGLMLLPEDAPVGKDIREWLALNDQVIEVDFTPNRGDCLSIAGMAREVGVLNSVDVENPASNIVTPTIDDLFPVEVKDSAACPVYLGRVIRNVNTKATTPLWMQERLRRAGNRSLGILVDVTNYILLEMGQPMHAFDLDRINDKIVVRRATQGEKIKLLDDSEIELSTGELVIADATSATAFAGVMGGADSAVGDETQHLFLECAFFSPDAIRGKARRYSMQTDSSYRFERGVDFELQARAMERATQLIVEIAGGDVGPVTEVRSNSDLPKREAVTLRKARLKRVLGIEVADETVTENLQRLGMATEFDGESWKVIPPSYRFDIAIEADLIEEVGRIYGYNNIPMTLPKADLNMPAQPEGVVGVRRIRQLLVDHDYQEAITYSFVDEAQQQALNPDVAAVKLQNPISAEMSVMRTSLWTGLLHALSYNQKRQKKRVRLFEVGVRFSLQDNEKQEERVVSGVVCGSHLPEQWSSDARDVDFFDLKGDVEALLSLAKGKTFTFVSEAHPALHPGQSAAIRDADGELCGYLGLLHPQVSAELDLEGSVFLFEIGYEHIANGALPVFQELSKFPAVRRDIAVIVDETVSAQRITECVSEAAGGVLQELQLFDLYQGKGVDSGRKSVALGLTLQEFSRTLTDTEIDGIIEGVLSSLNKNLGATLRE